MIALLITEHVQAEEAKGQVLTAVSQTTLSGYIDTSVIFQFGNHIPVIPTDGLKSQDITPITGTTLSGYIDSTVASQFGPQIQAVPEPATLAFLVIGSVAMGFIVQRRKI
jgi:citrate lyase gamma subunit